MELTPEEILMLIKACDIENVAYLTSWQLNDCEADRIRFENHQKIQKIKLRLQEEYDKTVKL
ncbi:MAG: hypothetical protein IJ122_06055 [Methanobrevibacter sp.]|nr:hypothetical protein [Methanobrevibacter sp.]